MSLKHTISATSLLAAASLVDAILDGITPSPGLRIVTPAAREALALATDSLRAAHLAYRAVHRATVARTLSDEEVGGIAILTREAQRILSEFGLDSEP